LPLALELAAARSKLFSPQALLSRLGDRLALLTGGGRDLPAPDQTGCGAIGWGVKLVSSAEELVFAGVGVVLGGVTLGAGSGGGECLWVVARWRPQRPCATRMLRCLWT